MRLGDLLGVHTCELAPAIRLWILRLLVPLGGVAVGTRTLQRDLNEMMECLEIETDRDKPAPRWRWRKDSPWLLSPSADATQAVAWKMLERHVQDLMPPGWMEALSPFFEAAQRGMTKSERMWLENVRVIPTTFALQAPEIAHKVRDLVCDALKEQRQISFSYIKQGMSEQRYEAVNPLGLVQRDKELILVATHARSEGAVREFLLHRIGSIRQSEQRAQRPAGFSLDEYIRTGGFQFSDGTMQRVTLKVSDWLGVRLQETPMSRDQTVERIADDRWTVTATVPNSMGFKWWLMTLEDNVEVIDTDSG